MKKEIVIVLILVILIIIGNIYTQKQTNDFFEKTMEGLNEVQNIILNEKFDVQEIQNRLDEIEKEWNSKYDKFAYYVEHDELEKIEIEIISINTNFRVGEYNRCVEESKKCIGLLDNLKEKDALKLVNIF